MKNYTSLCASPHTDYTKFTGGMGGLADNTMIKRLENYETKEEHEINKKSFDNSKLGVETKSILAFKRMCIG